MRTRSLLGLLVLFGAAGGCAPTVTMTAKQNDYLQKEILEIETRELADDWNMVWLDARPSRLSRWYMR